MIEDLKIIKAQLENEQAVNYQVTKNNKKNVSASKQKNKAKSVSNSESGLCFPLELLLFIYLFRIWII